MLPRSDLSNNHLDGTFPDLSALRSLRYMYGPPPPWQCVDWTDLNHWPSNLSGNNLTGEFPDLSQLSNLTTLYVTWLTRPIPLPSFIN